MTENDVGNKNNYKERIETLMSSLSFNDERSTRGLKIVKESMHVESKWKIKDGFMYATVYFLSETVCNNGLKPWDEILKTVNLWENIPITFEHPYSTMLNDPSDVIGFMREIEIDEEKHRLKGVLYVMLEPAAFNKHKLPYWRVMLEAIKERSHVSVGFWCQTYDEDGTFTDLFGNTKPYYFVATEILPDHIASVETGACTPDQGCGVESEDTEKTQIKEKKGLINMDEDTVNVLDKLHSMLNKIMGKLFPPDPETPEDEQAEQGSEHYDTTRDLSGCGCNDASGENILVNDMTEKTNEEEEMDQDATLEDETSECSHISEIEEKNTLIEELKRKCSELEESVKAFEEKERETLISMALELTSIKEEDLEKMNASSLSVLIEGARSSKIVETKEQINLNSPPSSQVENTEINLFKHPLDKKE